MRSLCQAIAMPEEMTRRLLSVHTDPAFCPDLSLLTQEGRWEEGLSQLRTALGPDPDGVKMLCCMLRCALAARQEYARLGLSDEIYFDTMAAFSRFVREHFASYGRYGFDRGFWTVRQVSCKLFRIGQLEYELTAWHGENAVSLHIPTDASLRLPGLRASWEAAKQVLARVFPDYAEGAMFCTSWLLSPTLAQLLPPQSHILQFQRAFTVTSVDPDAQGYVQWVFKDPRLAPADYPEDTSLQRALKAYLLNGGTFLSATGILSENPFLLP